METQKQEPSNVSALPAVSNRKQSEIRVVQDPIPLLDTARFEHMQRIAVVMAETNLIPESLCTIGRGNEKEYLPMKQIVANCFLVVNQAVRWNMDPFAVAQCVSVIHGRLCYEGKLIAAVLEAQLGVNLEYEIVGQGDQTKVVVRATDANGKLVVDSKGNAKAIEGTVADWKTTGTNSPWAPKNFARMLRYRGAREWSRAYAPGTMLGVYSPDELEEIGNDVRANRAVDVTPTPPAPPPPPRPPAPQLHAATKSEQTEAAPAPKKRNGNQPQEMPNPTDPEAMLKWIDLTLGAITEADPPHALETVWNDQIEPRLTDMFPPDREEAVGLFRKHERRLER